MKPGTHSRKQTTDILHYIRQFANNPEATGSVAPSSGALAREVVRGLELSTAKVVLEYGPGMGVFTPFVLAELPASCRFLAIELNPSFAAHFRARFPGVELHEGDVGDVRRICDDRKVAMVDCIVSGLPWAAFSLEKQEALLQATVSVLKPGGRFTTFAYVHGRVAPSGRRFLKMLRRHFSDVQVSPVIWSNIPPAVVYKCRV